MSLTINQRRARMIAIARLVFCGESFSGAGAKHGVSAGRCRTMVEKLSRMALHPNLRPGPMPVHDWLSVRAQRKHREFWLERMNAVERHWSAVEEEKQAGTGG